MMEWFVSLKTIWLVYALFGCVLGEAFLATAFASFYFKAQKGWKQAFLAYQKSDQQNRLLAEVICEREGV